MRGADVLAAALGEAGIETVFALSGNQIMPVFDALLGSGIRLLHTRHETAAVYMAEGYARSGGGTGVALVTAGAGLANAITPLLSARATQTPLLLLSGDSPARMDGRGAFQEMDQVAVTATLAKRAARVTDPGNVAAEIRAALAEAESGQPGPVHLSLPVDVLEADAPPCGPAEDPAQDPAPDPQPVLDALAKAERPLILLGPQLVPSRAALDLGGLGAPVLPMESPRGARDPNLGRHRRAWGDADLVVALGKPIDFSVEYGAADSWPQARWVAVHGDRAETRRAELNLGDRLEAGITAAPRAMAEALAQATGQPDRADWIARVAELVAARPAARPAAERIGPDHLCRAVRRLVAASDDAIAICDGGEFGQWAQSLVDAPRRILGGVAGAIGGGFCYAMGARAANPGADVFALMGDGSAGFHLTEFETAVRESLPFVAVIGNDRRWNAEHLIQERSFGAERTHGCDLTDARYDEAAAALGGFGVRVERPGDLDDALAEALASGRPACVNVMIEGLAAPVLE